MKAERWEQLNRLFHLALETDPHNRVAFLDRECGEDAALRTEVEALLEAHDKAQSFIEAPALEVEAAKMADDQPRSKSAPLTGQVISHYRVTKRLGGGGMGDVYLAQDLSLGRQVALKLLPPHFTSDPERLRRFEQEARAASALNHPNILTIYEIGRHNSLRFIATEFIDGVTLRDRMTRNPLQIDDAIDLAIQVADALTAAHAKGIVHRDIKPENIMICMGSQSGQRKGHVKVLDFGIAKLTEAETAETDLPTRPLVSTHDGITIGTAPYMSPEQARGEKVDARTDIWSLSVVLYELLSGRAPFEGATHSHLIVSILEKEPRRLREVADIPEALEKIVHKGLRKDRDDRYQTAREFYNDLKEFSQQFQNSSRAHFTGKDTTGVSRVGTRPTPARKALLLGIAFLVVAISAMALGFKYIWPKISPRHAIPFSKSKLTKVTTHGKASSAVISPDGKYVVHVAGSIEQMTLRLRHIATGSDQEIVPASGNDQISSLSFSPDGNRIYFTRTTDSDVVLESVPVLGGPPKQILHDLDSAVTFAPDGQRFAFVRGSPQDATASLIIANADGSSEQKLITRNIKDFFFGPPGNPAWSPDGHTIAIVLLGPESYRNVVAVDIKDRTEKRITSEQWNSIHSLCWLPDGSGLLITAIEPERRNTQIFYSSYPTGKVERITNDLDNYEDISVTADGTSAVTVMSQGDSDVWISSADDLTEAKRVTSSKYDGVGGIAWTPDGKVVHVSNMSGSRDIWIMNADGSEDHQLTSNAGLNLAPCVSADGRYILFMSNRSGMGIMNLWRINMDGSNPTQLTSTQAQHPECTNDNHVVYSSDAAGQGSVWKISVEGGTPVRLTDYYAFSGPVSPRDGNIAIGFLDEKATPPRRRIGLIASNGGPPTAVFDFPIIFGTLGGGFYGQVINWTADGKSLTYIDTKDGVSNIWAQPIDGGPKRQLSKFKSDLIFNYAWSGDGKKVALARGSKTSDVVLIKDVTN